MIKPFLKNKLNIVCLGLIVIIQLIVCLPQVGKGFITDDFIWIDNALTEGKLDFLKPFVYSTGFYRPLISLTFGCQYHLHGMNARPYGLFNLCFHIFNIILIYLFFSLFEFSKKYALSIAFLFSLNIKCIPMAVGWISGRTSLLFTFFSLISLVLFKKAETRSAVKKYILYVLVNLAFLAALFSKETAIMIPMLVFVFTFFSNREQSKRMISGFYGAIKSFGIFILPLVTYFFLRIKSKAFTPFNAPDSYSFGTNPFVILKNFWEYFFRAGLLDFFMIFGMLLFLVLKWKKVHWVKPDCQAVYVGCVWFLVFLLPVLFLRVRSDLYVYLPQAGIHLIFIFLMVYLWESMGFRNMKIPNRYVVFLPVLIFLVIWMFLFAEKTSMYRRAGHQSSLFIREMVRAVPQISGNSHIYILDTDKTQFDPPRKTISYGFDSLLKLFYFYPYKKLSGEIMVPDNLVRINRIRNSDRLLFWYKKQLIGPVGWATFFDIISGFSFFPKNFPEIDIKTKNTVKKRLTRFQKRKLGLKKLRIQRESGLL